MTLNIWNLSGPWRQRRQEIAAWIGMVEPDIVCLQEVCESDGRNQAAWLSSAAGLGHHVAYAAGSVIQGHGFGNAILSRWPIEASQSQPLPDSAAAEDTARVVLHARTNGLDVYSTHLAWRLDDGAVRERQVQVLADWVAATSHSAAAIPPIVAGDFNAEPDSTEIRYMSGLAALDGKSVYFQDAWRVAGGGGPGYTWDNRNEFAVADREPDRRIDYIFLGWRPLCGAGFTGARLVCDRALTGVHASDHLGVAAEIFAPAE